jgi:hypothetical protein
MKKFSESLLATLERQIETIYRADDKPIMHAQKAIKVTVNTFEELKTFVIKYTFNSKDEEIDFFKNIKPKETFSLVIASDFLHFFSLNECKNIISQIITRTQKNSLIYVKVHSISNSYSDSTDSGVHEYFKHFFTESNLTELFDDKYFERMIFSNTVQNVRTKFTREMETKWTEKVLDEYQIFDPVERQEQFDEINKELNVGFLECIYRRK